MSLPLPATREGRRERREEKESQGCQDLAV